MSTTKRLAKRWKREHREVKNDGSWRCRCGERHPEHHRCPNYINRPALAQRYPFPGGVQ